MNKLFILCGASGAGKSTILNEIVSNNICKQVPKYTERKKFNDIDDIISVDNIRKNELNCDILYSMYGNLYGFSSKTIRSRLQKDNQILITNNIDAIKTLKTMFPNQVIAVYVLSFINRNNLLQIYIDRYGFPELDNNKKILKHFLLSGLEKLEKNNTEEFFKIISNLNLFLETIIPESEKYKQRTESIENIAKKYTEYILNYDYVLLNFYSINQTEEHITQSAYEQLVKIINKESFS